MTCKGALFETSFNCALDCGGGGTSSCGDGICNGVEDCLSCEQDCNSKLNGNPSGRYCCHSLPLKSYLVAYGLGCDDALCTADGKQCGYE